MAKILVVDDAESIRQKVLDAFSGLGIEVLQAADGAEGIKVVGANPDLDVVITDFNMPGMDGTEMVETITNTIKEFDGFFVMLTTETDFELKSKGKQAGIKYWINKPFDAEKLTKIIQKLIERGKAA